MAGGWRTTSRRVHVDRCWRQLGHHLPDGGVQARGGDARGAVEDAGQPPVGVVAGGDGLGPPPVQQPLVGLAVEILGRCGSPTRRPCRSAGDRCRSGCGPASLRRRRSAPRRGPRPPGPAWRTRRAAARGTPAMSACPCRDTGSQATPSRAVSSARRAAWYTIPAGFNSRCSARESNARHTPSSAERTRPETRTWVCNWGSPARDERCTNAAPTSPSLSTWRIPALPARVKAACSSRYASPAPRRRRGRRGPACRSPRRRSPTPRYTDLGAENVRSQPSTLSTPSATL